MHSATIIASVASLAVGALATNIGSAVIINSCSYEVYLANTPSEGSGQTKYVESDTILKANGGQFTQTWTSLSNGGGWSMKLGMNKTSTDIMQYEYTYDPDTFANIIWYDLSDVNGNPWNKDWEITASSSSGTCNPKQQAYQYATDDAYGMQACPIDSEITVTLCSGDNNGAAASASSSAAVQSSIASTASSFTTPTSSAPTVISAPSETASSGYKHSFTHTFANNVAVNTAASSSNEVAAASASSTAIATSASPTTFATSSTAVITEAYGATVTEVQTAVVTDIVTATYYQGKEKRNEAAKRHEHHPRHPHGARL